jgi:hypothetical protein
MSPEDVQIVESPLLEESYRAYNAHQTTVHGGHDTKLEVKIYFMGSVDEGEDEVNITAECWFCNRTYQESRSLQKHNDNHGCWEGPRHICEDVDCSSPCDKCRPPLSNMHPSAPYAAEASIENSKALSEGPLTRLHCRRCKKEVPQPDGCNIFARAFLLRGPRTHPCVPLQRW